MNVKVMDYSQTARWGKCRCRGAKECAACGATPRRPGSRYAFGVTTKPTFAYHLKRFVRRYLFAARYRKEKDGFLGVVGTAAALTFPDRPHWVRVEQTVLEQSTTAALVLPPGTRLVPLELPDDDALARRWMHRLVAAEAARREVDSITRRAPTHDPEWKRAADAYLAKFRNVQSASAMAREVLFEDLTREVQLRFLFMVRRLRKARSTLMETGCLTNRDLEELWERYRYCDEDAQDIPTLEAQGLLPDRLRPITRIEPGRHDHFADPGKMVSPEIRDRCRD